MSQESPIVLDDSDDDCEVEAAETDGQTEEDDALLLDLILDAQQRHTKTKPIKPIPRSLFASRPLKDSSASSSLPSVGATATTKQHAEEEVVVLDDVEEPVIRKVVRKPSSSSSLTSTFPPFVAPSLINVPLNELAPESPIATKKSSSPSNSSESTNSERTLPMMNDSELEGDDDEDAPAVQQKGGSAPEYVEGDSVLMFDWRSSSITTTTASTYPPPAARLQISAPVGAASQEEEKPKKKKRTAAAAESENEEPKTKKPRKPKKGAKTEEEKLAIAVALGKHRNLELRALASSSFLAGPVGGAFEYYMIENERQINVTRDDTVPADLVIFRRHALRMEDEGSAVFASTDEFFTERLALLVWTGIDLVSDLKFAHTKQRRLQKAREARAFVDALISPETGGSINLVVILENCDGALAAHRLPPRDLEDFLVMDLGVGLGMSHLHVSNAAGAGEMCFSHFHALEKWPYKKAERAADFLDLVKRFKSFSSAALQESAAAGDEGREKRTNRQVDGSQLGGVWANQLRCIPRISETVAESVVEKYPSFRSLFHALQDNPAQVETNIQQVRGARRELKLARVVCKFFTSEDPTEKLSS